MQNPLESEDAAFRFLLGTIACAALIVAASLIATWLGLLAMLVIAGVLVLLHRRRKPEPPAGNDERVAVEDTWRVLVLASATPLGVGVRDALIRMAEGVAEDILVVCPGPRSAAHDTPSGGSDTYEAATARLQTSLWGLERAGLRVRGEIGSDDPMQAFEEALRSFSPDAVVVSVRPCESSSWLELGVVEAVRARLDVSVTHVVDSAPEHDDGTIAPAP